MARTVDEIQLEINSALVTNFAALGITINTSTWSKRNMLRMLCYTFAVVTAYLEQLMDNMKASLELTASKSASASALWLQAKMFLFQYSATNPQYVVLVDTVPQYAVIDTTLQIIKACSITSPALNEVLVKVAKQSPLIALLPSELTAAQAYINMIGTAGIQYIVESKEADRIYIDATIYYQGQYSATIQSSVIAAIDSYFLNLSVNNFNGSVKMSDIEGTIRNVSGVNDVILNNVRGRLATYTFDEGIDLILDEKVINRQWNSIAGYCVSEDLPTHQLTNSLQFTAE